jgi:hypothetical protein
LPDYYSFDRLLWLQNSSYYDTDGIYGNTYSRNIETNTQNNQNQYKEYFGSLRDDNQTPEVFTDIDNYNDYNLDNDQENYPGWGSNPQGVSINVYDTGWAMNNWYGNNWGWNGGFGWGMNNWYGNNWGMNNWGWNGNYGWGMNFGFGLNNFGWNNWYGNNWYGNNWGIPITITIASTPTTQVEEGPQIQILQIQTEATIQHREHFLTTEAAARTFRETGVTLIGAQILSILEEVAIEKERTAP